MQIVEQDNIPADHSAKAALFDALAEVASAMSSGRRAELIDILAQGERSVEELSSELEQSVANTSHHLRTLARASLIRSRREGTHIFYRIANEEVEELWTSIRRVAETVRADLVTLAEAYLGHLEGLEVIGREDLMKQLANETMTVLDVRPNAEYRAGHVPGARSVPLAELTGRLEELPEDLPVVAYCRGSYCVFAPKAVQILREHGFKTVRLEEGFPEWRRAGLPVEFGD